MIIIIIIMNWVNALSYFTPLVLLLLHNSRITIFLLPQRASVITTTPCVRWGLALCHWLLSRHASIQHTPPKLHQLLYIDFDPAPVTKELLPKSRTDCIFTSAAKHPHPGKPFTSRKLWIKAGGAQEENDEGDTPTEAAGLFQRNLRKTEFILIKYSTEVWSSFRGLLKMTGF